MNKILVTGGAGFIGSNLSNRLLETGQKVYVIDNLSKGKIEFLKNGVELIIEDISSKKASALVKKIKPEYIVHLAAESNLAKSYKNPKKDLENNFFPIVQLVEISKEIEIKKFIFASSAAVFGNTTNIPILETFLKEPSSPYGVSKLCAEYYLYFASQKYNLPYITLRFANVYGKNQNSTAEGGVVAIFVSNVLRGNKVIIFGNGKQTRDFIYVEDVVDAIIASLKSNNVGDYNVGTSKETTVNDLLEIVMKTVGQKIPVEYKKNNDFGVMKNALSCKKISKQLKWKPKTTLESGIKMTIGYFKTETS